MKKFISILLTSLLTFVFISCGNKTEKSNPIAGSAFESNNSTLYFTDNHFAALRENDSITNCIYTYDNETDILTICNEDCAPQKFRYDKDYKQIISYESVYDFDSIYTYKEEFPKKSPVCGKTFSINVDDTPGIFTFHSNGVFTGESTDDYGTDYYFGVYIYDAEEKLIRMELENLPFDDKTNSFGEYKAKKIGNPKPSPLAGKTFATSFMGDKIQFIFTTSGICIQKLSDNDDTYLSFDYVHYVMKNNTVEFSEVNSTPRNITIDELTYNPEGDYILIDNKLRVDCVNGKFTPDPLIAEPADNIGKFLRTIRYRNPGMYGDDVLEIQSALIKAGFLDSSEKDGWYTDKTEKALIKFQKYAGLNPNGIFNEKTSDYLLSNTTGSTYMKSILQAASKMDEGKYIPGTVQCNTSMTDYYEPKAYYTGDKLSEVRAEKQSSNGNCYINIYYLENGDIYIYAATDPNNKEQRAAIYLIHNNKTYLYYEGYLICTEMDSYLNSIITKGFNLKLTNN